MIDENYGIESRPAAVVREAIKNNRLAQTLLFYGHDINALQELANHFAAELLAADDNIESHPDIFKLTPSGKARQIKIGEGIEDHNTVRSFIYNINLSPRQGNKKVGIISEVDCLNNNSANALLKTLEEPPNDTTLILLTSHPYRLMDTIRSRCISLKIPTHLPSIETGEWKDWLDDYSTWLSKLLSEKKNKEDNTHLIIAVYGLANRFKHILHNIHKDQWSDIKESLETELSSEQVDAMASGHEKGIRKIMLSEIQNKTRDTAIENESSDQHKVVAKLSEAVKLLERSSGLLELNYKAEAALEYFLLNSLRIWARA